MLVYYINNIPSCTSYIYIYIYIYNIDVRLVRRMKTTVAEILRMNPINQKVCNTSHASFITVFTLSFSLSFNMIAYCPFNINCVTHAGDRHTSLWEELHIHIRHHLLHLLSYRADKFPTICFILT